MRGSAVNERVLREESRLVWRAVRDAHVLGITQVGLQLALGASYSRTRLRYLLGELREAGFVRNVRSNGAHLWVLGSYLMPGESERTGAGPVQAAEEPAAKPAHRLGFQRCSSIWQYAAQMGA